MATLVMEKFDKGTVRHMIREICKTILHGPEEDCVRLAFLRDNLSCQMSFGSIYKWIIECFRLHVRAQ